MKHRILLTGGAGFIGSNFVHMWLAGNSGEIVNLDKLTYAANLQNLASVWNDKRHVFVEGDINDAKLVARLLRQHEITAVVHSAAESHVDRSILAPSLFIDANVSGTVSLLKESLSYWNSLQTDRKEAFRFLHVSTDEVFGSLGPADHGFHELTPYAPNSPYSASKAASDHFVRAFHHTYGLPSLITHCSNNYGPYQFPEKLIPLMIFNAWQCKTLPVYGDGKNIRDWLYVTDHCLALQAVLERGVPGQTYNIGGRSEMENLAVVHLICSILDELAPASIGSREQLIRFVKDRPGHDRRYAVDTAKIERELNWFPREHFSTGIRKTIEWYVDNHEWRSNVTSGAYLNWMATQYAGGGANVIS